MKEVNLNTAADGTITLSMIQALLKKKEAPEVIGTYKYKTNQLFLFGYTAGKAGTENKHELPPPHDTLLCFGDIILLSSKDSKSWTTPVAFKMSDYELFYTKAFGGFEDLGSEDEEEEELNEIVDEVEAEAEGEVEVEAEEEEAEEEEEEDEEEVEADVDAEGEEPVIVVRPVSKKKPRRPVAPVPGASGAAQVYSTYLHVTPDDELAQEPFESAYTEEGLSSHRRKILSTLRDLFANMLSETEVQQLERCIYNGAIRTATQRHIGKAWTHRPFLEMYLMFAKHIAANFHPDAYVGNKELYTRYKAGEITFKDISEMDTYQLFEERWKDSFLQQQVREKRQLEGNKSMATDQFLCMRCLKRECTYYEMQTRSADEPMTIFITCLNCGKHWRK